MTTLDLDALQAAAEAAQYKQLYWRTNRHTNTDGTPWGWLDLHEAGSMRQASPDGVQITWSKGKASERNAEFIAAANPTAILALIDRLRKAEAASKWQPIETAPKDGTWVRLTGGNMDYNWDGDNAPTVVSGQYSTNLNGSETRGHWQFAWYDGGYYGEYKNPTHWKPLDAAPTSADSEGAKR